MQVGTRESVALARGVVLALRGKKVLPEIVICPSAVALSEVRKIVTRTHVSLGAQNMFWEEQGAFTGEISSKQLAELGVTHVIIGHSERRQVLGETDEMIQKKVARALQSGLTPILCVGETEEERARGEAEAVVERQVRTAYESLALKTTQQLWLAYEPIWAIGTGKACEPADAVSLHAHIRSIATDLFPKNHKQIRVLYGGSVSGENAYAYLREDEIDGVLVGGASVKLSQFNEILVSAREVIEGKLSV